MVFYVILHICSLGELFNFISYFWKEDEESKENVRDNFLIYKLFTLGLETSPCAILQTYILLNFDHSGEIIEVIPIISIIISIVSFGVSITMMTKVLGEGTRFKELSWKLLSLLSIYIISDYFVRVLPLCMIIIFDSYSLQSWFVCSGIAF